MNKSSGSCPDPFGNFRIVSPGEITKGMYVTAFETVYTSREHIDGEYVMNKLVGNSIWIKGIPFYVLNVALPLVMVQSLAPRNNPNTPMAGALFFDTRYISFLEVSAEYSLDYINSYKSHGDALNNLWDYGNPAVNISYLKEYDDSTFNYQK